MEDYKERLVEEFNQTRDRANKLEKILRKNSAGKLDFVPTCPISMLKKQHEIMLEYLEVLKMRAIYENIDLEY